MTSGNLRGGCGFKKKKKGGGVAYRLVSIQYSTFKAMYAFQTDRISDS
jgi:hypothetical protein